MSSLFRPAFFIQNRKRLRELFVGTAPIVITAHGLVQRSGDTTYPFRQDSNFWYLTGITLPDIILVLDKEKEYLIVPDRELSRTTFDGQINMMELSEQSGIQNILGEKEGWKLLGHRLKRVKHVATLAAPSAYVVSHGMYANPARNRLIACIKNINKDLEFLDLRPHTTKMRSIKQEEEIRTIKNAVSVTNKAFKKVKKDIASFTHEYELEAVMTKMFREVNAVHGYQPIVATGKNACTLHYIQNSDAIMQDQMILIDAGAEIEGYSADITRTYNILPPTKRQQKVFDAVIDVQQHALSILKPGVIVKDYESLIEQYMGEKLRELGLIKSIETGEVRRYYPHAISHFLGLDVHDVADYSQPLEPGMVLTVEPGIYIPQESLGIRVEDNIVITSAGASSLSNNLPQNNY